MNTREGLSWLSIVRLGLVQTCLGANVVLLDSTFNRVMVHELGLYASVPGLLFGLYYAIQLSRPRWGYGADAGGQSTGWIIGGMALLATGTIGVAAALMLISTMETLGLVLTALAFILIGIGVGAAGTTLLAMTARFATAERRAPAAMILWIMMIFGFILTAATVGSWIDPFSFERLFMATVMVSGLSFVITVIAVFGIERRTLRPGAADTAPEDKDFRTVMAEIWGEADLRLFALFVFMSMLAYGAQDLILEPYGAFAFGLSVGETTKFPQLQYGGALIGMIVAGIACRSRRFGSLRMWAAGGCVASAVALAGLALSGSVGTDWPLLPNVFFLGLANGAFAIAAIGSMMERAGGSDGGREGTRMGIWGAAQGVAMGFGKTIGAMGLDASRLASGDPLFAYQSVFCAEAIVFAAAAIVALKVGDRSRQAQPISMTSMMARMGSS